MFYRAEWEWKSCHLVDARANNSFAMFTYIQAHFRDRKSESEREVERENSNGNTWCRIQATIYRCLSAPICYSIELRIERQRWDESKFRYMSSISCCWCCCYFLLKRIPLNKKEIATQAPLFASTFMPTLDSKRMRKAAELPLQCAIVPSIGECVGHPEWEKILNFSFYCAFTRFIRDRSASIAITSAYVHKSETINAFSRMHVSLNERNSRFVLIKLAMNAHSRLDWAMGALECVSKWIFNCIVHLHWPLRITIACLSPIFLHSYHSELLLLLILLSLDVARYAFASSSLIRVLKCARSARTHTLPRTHRQLSSNERTSVTTARDTIGDYGSPLIALKTVCEVLSSRELTIPCALRMWPVGKTEGKNNQISSLTKTECFPKDGGRYGKLESYGFLCEFFIWFTRSSIVTQAFAFFESAFHLR